MPKQQVKSCIIKTFDNPPTEKKVPQIVLCGEWLVKASFTAQTEFTIEYYSGIIILKAVNNDTANQ